MSIDQVKLLSQNQIWIQKIKERADAGPNTYTFEQPNTKWLFKVIFERRTYLVLYVFSDTVSLINHATFTKLQRGLKSIDYQNVNWQKALEEIDYENSL